MKSKKINFFLCFVSLGFVSFSQFQNISGSANKSWRTIGTFAGPGTPVGAIGIGNFPNTTVLPASLTINSNLLPFPTGEQIRTTGPANQNNAWRMFIGTGNGTEYFSLYNPANTTDINLKASKLTGKLIFHTQGSTTTTERLRITEDDRIIALLTQTDFLHLTMLNSK